MNRRFLLPVACIVGVSQASINSVYTTASIPPSLLHHDIRIRGGASESASAWNAGSSLRPAPVGSSPGQSYRSTPPYRQTSQQNIDEKSNSATKEQFAEAFLVREDRNRFIARVYAILSGQLLFTAGTIHLFHLNPQIRNWMLYSQAGRKVPLFGLLISTVAWWIALSSESARRSSMKWPILLAFTIGESIAVGFISSVYNYSTVIKAMTGTAISTFSVTAYTFLQKNPKYDLSQWGRALSGLGMAFILYGFIHVLELFGVLPHGFLPYTEALYSILGAALFNLYLAHHTRLIVSGKSSKYQMNEKDYMLGAMSLYSDIINIFLYILRLLGELDDNN